MLPRRGARLVGQYGEPNPEILGCIWPYRNRGSCVQGGMAPTERRIGRALLIWTAVAIAVIGVVLAGLLLYVTFVVQPRAGDVPSGVPCGERPSLVEVEDALEQQRALVERLEAIGDVTVIPTACSEGPNSRGEITIMVPSKSVSDAVQQVLEAESFTVPVSIRNV